MSEAPARAVAGAVLTLQARAIKALKPGMDLAIVTDATTYANYKRPAVLVAIARPHGCCVVAVDAAEFGVDAQLRLLEHLGPPDADAPAGPTAYDKAVSAKPAATAKKKR